jgi:hypothetical protein
VAVRTSTTSRALGFPRFFRFSRCKIVRLMRRWLLLAIVAAGTSAAAAHATKAALSLVFNRTTAPVGAAVSAHTPVRMNGALRKMLRSRALRRHPLRALLAARTDASSIKSVRDSRLVPLGTLRVDRRGRGRLTFSMPNVPPGDYTTFLQCVPCRRGPPSRALVPSGPFPGPLKAVDAPPVVRECSTSVAGNLPPDWQRYSIAAGPLTLYYWNASTLTDPRAFAARAPGRYAPIKILALVRGPATVTLSVPLDVRRKVALVYGPPSEWHDTMRISDGHAATTFVGCPDSDETQFNGGFIVAGSQCATFDVQVDAQREDLKLAVPFAASC